MHRVVLREVRVRLRVTQIVDGDDLDLVLAICFVDRAQNVASDSAVAVDTDLDGHCSISSKMGCRL